MNLTHRKLKSWLLKLKSGQARGRRPAEARAHSLPAAVKCCRLSSTFPALLHFTQSAGKTGLPCFSVLPGYPGRAGVTKKVKPVHQEGKGVWVLVLANPWLKQIRRLRPKGEVHHLSRGLVFSILTRQASPEVAERSVWYRSHFPRWDSGWVPYYTVSEPSERQGWTASAGVWQPLHGLSAPSAAQGW